MHAQPANPLKIIQINLPSHTEMENLALNSLANYEEKRQSQANGSIPYSKLENSRLPDVHALNKPEEQNFPKSTNKELLKFAP